MCFSRYPTQGKDRLRSVLAYACQRDAASLLLKQSCRDGLFHSERHERLSSTTAHLDQDRRSAAQSQALDDEGTHQRLEAQRGSKLHVNKHAVNHC